MLQKNEMSGIKKPEKAISLDALSLLAKFQWALKPMAQNNFGILKPWLNMVRWSIDPMSISGALWSS